MAEHGPFAQLVTEASRRLTVLCFVNPLCQPPFQPRNRTLGFSVSTAENDFAEIAVAVVPPCSPLLCKIAFFLLRPRHTSFPGGCKYLNVAVRRLSSAPDGLGDEMPGPWVRRYMLGGIHANYRSRRR
jgi:hypothetical protein